MRRRGRAVACAPLRQPRRRGRLSRDGRGRSRLHADQRSRAARRLHRAHRSPDGREPDPALVLQPRRPCGRQHPGPRAAAVGVALSPDRSPRASRRARRVRCAGRRSISWRARRSARACRPADDEQLRNGHGYDHCFAVDGWDGSLRTIAEVVEPVSRRRMLVRTTEPGVAALRRHAPGWHRGQARRALRRAHRASAWRRSVFRTRPTTPNFRRRAWSRARRTARRPSTCSPLA